MQNNILENFFYNNIDKAITIKKKLRTKNFYGKLIKVINVIYKSVSNNGKILICGNGGSASDAQHLVAEFLVRLRPNINRKPIPAIFLGMDIATITACSNDYSFKKIFSRNLEAIGKKEDILIILSTSGNSNNILEVLKVAKLKNIYSVALLGGNGGKAKRLADISLIVPDKETARIQENHIFLGHLIFQQVENLLIR